MDLDYCDNEWFALEMNRDHSTCYASSLQNLSEAMDRLERFLKRL